MVKRRKIRNSTGRRSSKTAKIDSPLLDKGLMATVDKRWPDTTEERRAELQSWLSIDKDALDDAVRQQPVLYDSVSTAASMIVSVRDTMKEELNRVQSRLAVQYRLKDPSLSDKRTNDLVSIDPKYTMAFESFMKVKERADAWLSLKSAWEQRASMLKYMVQLLTMRLSMSDSIPIEGASAKDILRDQRRKQMTEKRRSMEKKRGKK